MAFAIQVRNTFVDVVAGHDGDEVSETSRRSSSIPRSWKPASLQKRMIWSDVMSDTDDSTEAPSGSASEQEAQDDAEQSGQEQASLAPPPVPCTPLRRPSIRKGRSGAALRQSAPRNARHYPVQASGAEFVVGVLRCFLSTCAFVTAVQVEEGQSGASPATCITVEVQSEGHLRAGVVERLILAPARQALLATCQDSEDTYVLGYGAQPFRSHHDLAFKCSLGVAAEADDRVCWDALQYGACGRGACCHWWHPCGPDRMELTVQVRMALD